MELASVILASIDHLAGDVKSDLGEAWVTSGVQMYSSCRNCAVLLESGTLKKDFCEDGASCVKQCDIKPASCWPRL
jgi:hypothetical protein